MPRVPRVLVPVAALVVVAVVLGAGGGWAGAQGADEEEALAALEARVAAAEATIAALQTQVTELGGESTVAATPRATDSPTQGPEMRIPSDADPVPLNDDFELLYYYFAVRSSKVYVFGEMRNVGDEPAVAPRVIFTFLDEAGSPYGEEVIVPDLGRVPGAERVSFQALNVLDNALLPGEWAEVAVTAGEPVGSLADFEPLPLEIDGFQLEGPVAPLQGTVRNTGPEPIGPVTIRIAFYDNEDRFVGFCSAAYLEVTIPPERSVRLEIPDGGCGFFNAATEATNATGPFTYRLLTDPLPPVEFG